MKRYKIMREIIFTCVVVSSLCGALAIQAGTPVVSNVRASQRAGTGLVDIYYDLASASNALMVTVGISTNSGAMFNAPSASLSGDLGSGITPAAGRHVVWNAGTDLAALYYPNVKIRITADDSGTFIPPPSLGMVWIMPGTFVMGSPTNEAERSTDEIQHSVTLTKGFYMGKYPVTQGQYVVVVGSNPSYFKTNDLLRHPISPDLSRPVEQVSWIDASNYCTLLTQSDHAAGRIPPNWAYRLPTEAEWEYACRAGTTTAFNFGSAIHGGMANFYDYYEYDAAIGNIYVDNPSVPWLPRTTTAGSYASNAFGLYDMHGNVSDWCQDWYGTYSNPGINSQYPSTNLLLYAGASSTFSVVAAGVPPLYYSWFANGVVIGGATTASYTLTSAQAGSPTTFNCIVSNTYGTATGYVWTVSVIPTPTAPYPVSVLAAHPIGYWRLNEPDDGDGMDTGNDGAICHDYMGGNDGIYTNTVLGNPGYSQNTEPAETAALFGENDISFIDSYAGQIQGIDFSTPTNTSRSFSVEAWVNAYSQTSSGGIVSKGFGGGEQFDLDIISHEFRFVVRDANGVVHGPTAAFASDDSQWHHLVGVCDEFNGTVSLYVDSFLAGSSSIPTGGGILTATTLMTIGARMSAANNINNLQFEGYIDDVAVYNYALSPNQVAAQYSSAGGVPAFFSQQPPTNAAAVAAATLKDRAEVVDTPSLTNQVVNAPLKPATMMVYMGGTVVDPTGPASGSDRVFRGGDCGSYGGSCRSAVRGSCNPSFRLNNIGFRVVLAPSQ